MAEAKKVVKKVKIPGPKNKKNAHPLILSSRTLGQKASDIITRGAGSWTFILIFLILFSSWIAFNTIWLVTGRPWDEFPFILLNLALSLIAAIQAPIILMSQNRATDKDRQRADYDYAVNRKAEREIKAVKSQLNRIEKHMMMRHKE